MNFPLGYSALTKFSRIGNKTGSPTYRLIVGLIYHGQYCHNILYNRFDNNSVYWGSLPMYPAPDGTDHAVRVLVWMQPLFLSIGVKDAFQRLHNRIASNTLCD